jgi:hypothetical protein
LEQFLLDELPANQTEEIRRLLADDGVLRSRLEALEAEHRQFAASDRARAVFDRLQPRAERKTVPWFRSWAVSVPLGIGVAAVLFLVPLAFPPTGPDTRIKGGSTLEPIPRGFAGSARLEQENQIVVFGFQNGKTLELSDRSSVQWGDQVQVAVNIGRARHALLLSIDGSGHLTLQAPDSLKTPLVGDGTPKLLPFAYQLDDAPYFERFVLVTGTVLDAAAVWNDIAGQTAAWLHDHPGQPPVLRLGTGLDLSTFDLLKLNKEKP